MTVRALGVVIANAEHGRFGTPVSIMRDTHGHWIIRSIRTQLTAGAQQVAVVLGDQAQAAIDLINEDKDISQMTPEPRRGISRGGLKHSDNSTKDLIDRIQFVELGEATSPMRAVAAALAAADDNYDVAVAAPLATQRLSAADIKSGLALLDQHTSGDPRQTLLRAPGHSHGGFPWFIGSRWWDEITASADPESFTGQLKAIS